MRLNFWAESDAFDNQNAIRGAVLSMFACLLIFWAVVPAPGLLHRRKTRDHAALDGRSFKDIEIAVVCVIRVFRTVEQLI